MRFPLVLAASLFSTATLAQPLVAEAPLRAHLSFLADDLLEGRGTGQRGGDLAVRYLETQAAVAGLQPLKDGTYRQALTIVGSKVLPSSKVTFSAGGKTLSPAFGQDIVFGAANGQQTVAFDAPVVFAGYGIRAPEENWDDFKGADLKGKLVIMMVNDPQPTSAEPQRFAGKSLTYYGRWVYKYEEALRQGAAGVLLIHTTPSASYGWSVIQNSWSGVERFQLAQGAPGAPLEGWMTEDTARTLFKAGGHDLDALRAAAERKDFQPVALKVKVAGEMRAAVRKLEQFNVAGIIPGTDPKLKDEVVIYSAHWDHLGKQGTDGDTIFNGAVDNATGTGALLAMAAEASKSPAKRSQMFLWVAAEEQGLLGSAAYATAPLWPLAKTAANLNLDSLNFVGVTRDIGVQGSERSELRKMAEATAKAMKMTIAEARPDLSGGYFRSDHFSFAKAGVPAFSVSSGSDYLGDKAAAKAKREAYGKRYHQASDEYDPSWDFAGMAQHAQFTLNLGRAIADAPKMPAWKAGDAFGKVRAAK